MRTHAGGAAAQSPAWKAARQRRSGRQRPPRRHARINRRAARGCWPPTSEIYCSAALALGIPVTIEDERFGTGELAACMASGYTRHRHEISALLESTAT